MDVFVGMFLRQIQGGENKFRLIFVPAKHLGGTLFCLRTGSLQKRVPGGGEAEA